MISCFVFPSTCGEREPLLAHQGLPWGCAVSALIFWFYKEEVEAQGCSGPRGCAACKPVEPEFKASFSDTSGSLPWHSLEPPCMAPPKASYTMSEVVLGSLEPSGDSDA